MGGTDQRPLAIAPAAFAIATREGPQNVDSRRRSDGSNAQLPDIRERPGERVKSTVSGRSRNGPGDMSDGGESEGAGGIDDACRQQDRDRRSSYQAATAMQKSIYFAGRPGVLVLDTGLGVVSLPCNKCSPLPARGSRPKFPMERA
jgi:hypothetical protein